jgi:hypothetical protein
MKNLCSNTCKKLHKISCNFFTGAESEYVAMFATAKEIVWMRNVLHHVNLSQLEPTIMFCDNKSVIQLAKNPEFHKRTKHISVKYHYVRSCQKDAVISVQYVSTKDQLTDLFAKSLNCPLFENLRNAISVFSTPGSATK